jgi:hypothetical protein
MANEIIYSAGDVTKLPVAVASIRGIKKETITEGATTYYCIVFVMDGFNILWKDTVAGTRDTRFNKIITQYGYNTD